MPELMGSVVCRPTTGVILGPVVGGAITDLGTLFGGCIFPGV